MDTKELNQAIADLAEMDPAEAPDPADRVAETLAALLEASEEPEASPAA
jgi:hypothetical protein